VLPLEPVATASITTDIAAGNPLAPRYHRRAMRALSHRYL
jgi:hypothetical protein